LVNERYGDFALGEVTLAPNVAAICLKSRASRVMSDGDKVPLTFMAMPPIDEIEGFVCVAQD
jgi:hypothetical protein